MLLSKTRFAATLTNTNTTNDFSTIDSITIVFCAINTTQGTIFSTFVTNTTATKNKCSCVAQQQEEMMEWFDTLITVICGPTESASPLVKTHEVQQPAPPSSTSLDASTTYMPSGEHTKEDILLALWLQSASTKNLEYILCSTAFYHKDQIDAM